MRLTLATTAIAAALALPAAAAAQVASSATELPANYETSDLNRIMLQRVVASAPEPRQADAPQRPRGYMPDDVQSGEPAAQTIVSLAAEEPRFSTLVSLVQAAGLAGTLSGEGPYTLFAPTNRAFERLPEGTVEALKRPEAKGELAEILKAHVVTGRLRSTEIPRSGLDVVSLDGSELSLTFEGRAVRADGAGVLIANIEAGNGIVHAVDRVIMPDSTG